MTSAVATFARNLLSVGAVKFGEFPLKVHKTHPDAPLSPFYLDLRVLRSFPPELEQAVEVLDRMLVPYDCWNVDRLADVPTAATPFVTLLSIATGIGMITPHPPKGHGGGGTIDGVYEPGMHVLMFDDLITTAGSKVEAGQRLRDAGLVCTHVFVLVDRGQGREELAKHGYELHAAVTLDELFAFYLAEGSITQEQYDLVMGYPAQLAAWLQEHGQPA